MPHLKVTHPNMYIWHSTDGVWSCLVWRQDLFFCGIYPDLMSHCVNCMCLPLGGFKALSLHTIYTYKYIVLQKQGELWHSLQALRRWSRTTFGFKSHWSSSNVQDGWKTHPLLSSRKDCARQWLSWGRNLRSCSARVSQLPEWINYIFNISYCHLLFSCWHTVCTPVLLPT